MCVLICVCVTLCKERAGVKVKFELMSEERERRPCDEAEQKRLRHRDNHRIPDRGTAVLGSRGRREARCRPSWEGRGACC